MDLIIASSRGFQSDSHFGVVPLSCTKIYIRFVFAAMPVVNLPLAVIRCLYAGSYVLRLHSHSHFGVVPSMLEVRRANIMYERNHYRGG